MRRSTAVLIAVWLAVVGIVFYFERPQDIPTTPTTTVPALDCVAVTINVKTGVQTETPAPCHRGGTGCTGSITATINEDGTVTATCVPRSGNPAGQ